MALEQVKMHLKRWGKDLEIIILDGSSATVELAAKALNAEVGQIAKSISLYGKDDNIILIVASGHQKIDSKKFKDEFGLKAKMLPFEQVEELVGHPVGGVCPFGVNQGVQVYFDTSLKEWPYVYPACGSGNSAIKLTIEELVEFGLPIRWVDVTKV